MFTIIIPPKLQPGDTIGLIAPSSPVTAESEPQYRAGTALLEELGYTVRPGKYLSSTGWGFAASPLQKAADINAMLQDPQVRMLLAVQGGATANAVLPLLDYAALREDPKIILGISDVTVLLNAIHAQTGLVTYHGSDLLWGFGNQPTAYDLQGFEPLRGRQPFGVVPANGERSCIRSGSAEGKLLGGNLGCLLKLAGTAYFPQMQGAVLVLETYLETPENADCKLQQLKQMGVFKQIAGVLVGFNFGLDTEYPAEQHLAPLLLRAAADYHFPILKTNDFGHNTPNTTLPVGGRVRMDADALTYEILEG